MTEREKDELFMRRCLQLARNGWRNARPNPMVGAVIVSCGGRIIGEGYHVRCGECHAEVNAFASVRPEDEPLLGESTVYVSLEPCSHFGKTPPCADLIVKKGVKRVVCGCQDPFAKVQGRGIQRLRDAGIEVCVGVLERECKELNKLFMTFNTARRPHITLKWAQTANGMIGKRGEKTPISSEFTQMLVHKLRSEADAILIGGGTLREDAPLLNVRKWAGNAPERIVLTHNESEEPDGFTVFGSIETALEYLYEKRSQSLLVEGGAVTLQSFIDKGLWDEIRVETAPFCISGGVAAPTLPTDIRVAKQELFDGRAITTYQREE